MGKTENGTEERSHTVQVPAILGRVHGLLVRAGAAAVHAAGDSCHPQRGQPHLSPVNGEDKWLR